MHKIVTKGAERYFLVVIAILVGVVLMQAGNAYSQPPDCRFEAGALPHPDLPPGDSDESIPIDHILIILQENHSFDNYFGRLNQFGYTGQVDGVRPEMSNLDGEGDRVHVFHHQSPCGPGMDHSWNAAHIQYNNGRNDMFVIQNQDPNAMGYYEQRDIPFYYDLANTFAIGDRYFSSLLGPSDPQAFYLIAGTSFGHIRNDLPPAGGFTQPTLFQQLDRYGISWKWYYDRSHPVVRAFALPEEDDGKIVSISEYFRDLANGTLPRVAFMTGEQDVNDEHPSANIQIGQAFIADIVNALIDSRLWARSTLFLTYDEHDGSFDHVPPPEACEPDDIPPMLQGGDYQARFDRYGFRVPLVVVSPYAKRHYVSHETYDHTSILRFIETKYNLPALTARDANANPMLDFFDFSQPILDVPPLAEATIDSEGILRCLSNGNLPSGLTK